MQPCVICQVNKCFLDHFTFILILPFQNLKMIFILPFNQFIKMMYQNEMVFMFVFKTTVISLSIGTYRPLQTV